MNWREGHENDAPLHRSMTPRRVLMLAYHFPPVNSAGVYRTLRFVKYLPAFGWEPTVVTHRNGDVDWSEGADLLAQVPRDTRVISTGSWSPDRALNWLRHARANGKTRIAAPGGRQGMTNPLPDESISTLRKLAQLALETPDEKVWWAVPAVQAAIRAAREAAPHAVYSTGPPHSSHLIALAVKRSLGVPLVLDFRDPWARAPWQRTHRNPWGRRLLGMLEGICVRAANRVILNTKSVADEFRRHYRDQPSSKFLTIPNGYDPALDGKPCPVVVSAGPNTTTNGVLRLCHPGALYNRRDPRPLLEALARLAADGHRIAFEQIGFADPRFEIEAYATKLGISDLVRLHGQRSHAETQRLMERADLFAVLQPETAIQIPSKLFEMLRFRRPILALAEDGGETARVIQRYRLGVVAAPKNSDSIAAALLIAAKMRKQVQKNTGWSDAAEAFDGRKLTRRLAETLNACTTTR